MTVLILNLSDLAFSGVSAFAGKGETGIVPSLRGRRGCTPKKMSRLFRRKATAPKKTRS
jgi:hypothetical protein